MRGTKEHSLIIYQPFTKMQRKEQFSSLECHFEKSAYDWKTYTYLDFRRTCFQTRRWRRCISRSWRAYCCWSTPWKVWVSRTSEQRMTGSFSRRPHPAHTSEGPGNIDLTPRLGLCKTGVKSSSYIEWDISSIMP